MSISKHWLDNLIDSIKLDGLPKGLDDSIWNKHDYLKVYLEAFEVVDGFNRHGLKDSSPEKILEAINVVIRQYQRSIKILA